jgi:hypothetical protein
MKTPKYVKSDKSYFDPNTDTIYAPKMYGLEYFHEYSHWRDRQNPIYSKISIFMDEYLQILCMSTIILVFLFPSIIPPLFYVYAFFRIQEEVRAYIYTYRMKKHFEVENYVE